MKHLYLFVFFVFCGFTSLAQPANDDKADAILLEPDNFCYSSGSALDDASLSSGTIQCPEPTFSYSRDVWFKFVAQTSEYNFTGNRNISNSFAYQVTDEEGEVLACEEGIVFGGNTSSKVNFNLGNFEQGETYYIRVAFNFLGPENFSLCISPQGITGIPKVSDEIADIYLNPQGNDLVVKVKENKTYELKVFSLSGVEIYQGYLNQPESRISMEPYNNGMYIAVLSDNTGKLFRRKFLVQ